MAHFNSADYIGGFVGGTIGVMFIVGMILVIVGVVKWRSPAG